MKRFIFLSATALVGLAACAPSPSNSNAAANTGVASTAASAPNAQSGHFETTVLPGTKTANDIILKVNTATGASWVYCCSLTATSPIADTTPPPPGDYHLRAWENANPDGTQNWNVYRVDNVTGTVWAITGQGPYSWTLSK